MSKQHAVVALDLEFKEGFAAPSPEKLRDWIAACLNCNVNRVEVKVELVEASTVDS